MRDMIHFSMSDMDLTLFLTLLILNRVLARLIYMCDMTLIEAIETCKYPVKNQ